MLKPQIMNRADDVCVLCEPECIDTWTILKQSSMDLVWFQCDMCSSRVRKTRYLLCQDCAALHTTCEHCKDAVDSYDACVGHSNYQPHYEVLSAPTITAFVDHSNYHSNSQDPDAQPIVPPGSQQLSHVLPGHLFEYGLQAAYYHHHDPDMQYSTQYEIHAWLHEELKSFEDYHVPMQDDRESRETRSLKTMRRFGEMPVDMQERMSKCFTYGLWCAETLTHNESDWSAQILQKLLVLTQANEKAQLIQVLSRRSGYMIVGQCMCFVASQIILEAEFSECGRVAEAAHNFFRTAHANSGNLAIISSKHLLRSMQHKNANFSFQSWIVFMGKRLEHAVDDGVLCQILEVAKSHQHALTMCKIGCRSLLRIFEIESGSQPRSTMALRARVSALASDLINNEKLPKYIFDQYANHCVQAVIQHDKCDCTKVAEVLVAKKFEDVILHEHANYVLQCLLVSSSYKKFLPQVAQKFLDMEPPVMHNLEMPVWPRARARRMKEIARWKGIADILSSKLLEFSHGQKEKLWSKMATAVKDVVKTYEYKNKPPLI